MKKKTFSYMFLTVVTIISFSIKLVLILKYKNLLTLSSDDLNYVKCAVVLLTKGNFTFFNINEPSVFVMPLYPFFLSGVFKVTGYGIFGLQTVRVIQAVLSSFTIVFIFLIAENLFNHKIANLTAFFVAFYMPNINTSGYLMTETIFTTFLYLLIYLSLIFSERPSKSKFFILGVVWLLTSLCRPTIALYPIFLFLYLFLRRKIKFLRLVQLGTIMATVFILMISPWWIRNYIEVGEFIPLTASSGNPMLQGTYVNYLQTPENTVVYKMGKNMLETNKIEVNIAKNRIKSEFERDFWGYLKWFTLGKTYYLWYGVFYWQEYFNIGSKAVLLFHEAMLLGFIGMIIGVFKQPLRYFLPIAIVIYFNIIHCVYMAFDRYAFPLMPIISMFCAYFLNVILGMLLQAYNKIMHR